MIDRAMDFAVKVHRGQHRDGVPALPYVSHVVDVLNKLRYVGRVEDESMLCAALLHDVIEESGVGRSELEREFGGDVAGLVLQLTREEPGTSDLEGKTEAEIRDLRSRLLLDGVRKMDARAHAIKLADRLSNLLAAEATRPKKKLKRYVSQSREILEIVPPRANPALWSALDREVQRLEQSLK